MNGVEIAMSHRNTIRSSVTVILYCVKITDFWRIYGSHPADGRDKLCHPVTEEKRAASRSSDFASDLQHVPHRSSLILRLVIVSLSSNLLVNTCLHESYRA